jgi:hypothetical protein
MEKDTIKLNVGGRHFETTRETLLNAEYFKCILEGNWSESNSNKEIFIDRDSDLFSDVLKVLRGYDVPQTYLLSQELLFYGIELNYEKREHEQYQ